MKLSRDTLIEVSPTVAVEFDHGRVTATSEYGLVECGAELFGLFAAFRVPVTLQAGLERVSHANGSALRVDWVAASALALRCVDAGILRQVGTTDGREAVAASPTTYEAPRIHIEMLEDRERTDAYRRAIAATVRPGDVVVDVGTGNGVLAVAAAQAGARIVYAIEQSGIADTAARVFAANGVADRVRIVRGTSSAVSLPERADVMVSELIGHDALGERALEYTSDAVKRFVKPGGKVIPSGLRVYAQGVELDQELLEAHRVLPSTTARWREWYGTEFAPFEALALVDGYRVYLPPHEAHARCRNVTEPVTLAAIDLTAPSDTVECRATVNAVGGRLDAWLSWWELDLAPGCSISTEPGVAKVRCHWDCTLWFAGESRQVGPQERFELRYRRALTRTRLDVTPTA